MAKRGQYNAGCRNIFHNEWVKQFQIYSDDTDTSFTIEFNSLKVPKSDERNKFSDICGVDFRVRTN